MKRFNKNLFKIISSCFVFVCNIVFSSFFAFAGISNIFSFISKEYMRNAILSTGSAIYGEFLLRAFIIALLGMFFTLLNIVLFVFILRSICSKKISFIEEYYNRFEKEENKGLTAEYNYLIKKKANNRMKIGIVISSIAFIWNIGIMLYCTWNTTFFFISIVKATTSLNIEEFYIALIVTVIVYLITITTILYFIFLIRSIMNKYKKEIIMECN